MFLNLDNYLDVQSSAVRLRSQRATILANNLANSDTPNFKARDISFRDSLITATNANSASSLSIGKSNTHQAHISFNNPVNPTPLYRVPTQISLDGNTVQTDIENGMFAENSIRHEASLRFLGGKINGLIKALKGE